MYNQNIRRNSAGGGRQRSENRQKRRAQRSGQGRGQRMGGQGQGMNGSGYGQGYGNNQGQYNSQDEPIESNFDTRGRLLEEKSILQQKIDAINKEIDSM